MAGKTYVSGTAYDITGGKTLIGGTAYDINAGKTLVSGTAYDIGIYALPTVEELFSTATMVGGNNLGSYVNSSSQSSLSFPTGVATSDVGICYAFPMVNGYLGIWKYDPSGTGDNKWTQTPIYQMDSSYCGVIRSSGFYYINNGGFATSGTVPTFYSATSYFIKFSNDYDISVVDYVLSHMTITRLAGRNTNSQYTVSTSDKTNQLYLMSSASLSWWKHNGTQYVQVGGHNWGLPSQTSTSIAYSNTYGASIVGLS